MKLPFREHHLFALLDFYQEHYTLPLDRAVNLYFRQHKSLGSKDRSYIAEMIYGMVRWQGLLDFLSQGPVSPQERFRLYQQIQVHDYLADPAIPEHVRVSFPKALYEMMAASHGREKAYDLSLTSNTPAPATIRVNPLKISRDAFLAELQKDDYKASPCLDSEFGIVFEKKINFFSLPAFKAGFFEVQDEGSQLIAGLMRVEPGQQVMDYCCGSGGKALAFAHRMGHSGQIYMHDIRAHILLECRRRFSRAGIQNAQFMKSDDPQLKKQKKKMDGVLVDAPCSGTGTLRRNPDMKWKFTKEMVARLVGEQRSIFEKALSFVKPGGRIVYATCSLLAEENQQQMEHFLKTYPIKLEGEPFQCLPENGGKDGFFGVGFINQP